MAQLSITIPDNAIGRVQDAFAAQYGYSATIEGPDETLIPNPESKAQFTRRQVAIFVKSVLKAAEANAAAEVARQAAINNAEGVTIS